MADTSLVATIAEFLKRYPPFSSLDEEDLAKLARNSDIRFIPGGAFVYYRDNHADGEFYVVQKGAVEKLFPLDRENRVVDLAETGDIFGVSSLISKGPYTTTTRALEDTMLYTIPWDIFRPMMERNTQVALFFASGYDSAMPYIRFNLDDLREDDEEFTVHTRNQLFQEDEEVPLKHDRPLVSCVSSTTIREAAEHMTREKVGSIIVMKDGCPAGIVTDVDFRARVVAQGINMTMPVSSIMSSPVHTVAPGIKAGEAIMRMTRHGIRHLVVTDDGTDRTRAIALISEHDLILLYGNNPAIIVKEVMHSRLCDDLAQYRLRMDTLVASYLKQGVSVSFVANIASGIQDALLARAIECAAGDVKEELGFKPTVPFAWLSMGSNGRGEQIIITDQDNALVYDDPPSDEKEDTARWFLTFARRVNAILKDIGYRDCPSNMMAGNENLCRPLSGWKEYFTRLIGTPGERELMHASIYFDFRVAWGNEKLGRQLADHIKEQITLERSFVPLLARSILRTPPPLSFFKNMILEKSGEHKNELDLKLRGLMPLVDTARVLSLELGFNEISSTRERYERAAREVPHLADLCSFAVSAFELLLRYRALHSIRRGDSGRYIDPGRLKKIDRNALKNAFRTIEKLQEMLRVRYQLDYLR